MSSHAIIELVSIVSDFWEPTVVTQNTLAKEGGVT